MFDDYDELIKQPLLVWSAVMAIAFILFMRFKNKLQVQKFETARILIILMPCLIGLWLIYALVNAIINL